LTIWIGLNTHMVVCNKQCLTVTIILSTWQSFLKYKLLKEEQYCIFSDTLYFLLFCSFLNEKIKIIQAPDSEPGKDKVNRRAGLTTMICESLLRSGGLVEWFKWYSTCLASMSTTKKTKKVATKISRQKCQCYCESHVTIKVVRFGDICALL
jgi:hypothetical protein